MLVQLNEGKRMFSAKNNVKIDDVPDYEIKTPLQRAIQLMKRHRNHMYSTSSSLNYDDKPISIIITTLAARAYSNEANLYDSLMNILKGMPKFIKKKNVGGKMVTWVENPVDHRENFADKWEQFPEREVNFYYWLREAETFFSQLLSAEKSQNLNESLRRSMGDKLVNKTLSELGESARTARESGSLGFMPGLGIISESADKKIPNHTFHGRKE